MLSTVFFFFFNSLVLQVKYFLVHLLQLPEKLYKSLDNATRFLRFKIPFPMLAYPFYLVSLHFSVNKLIVECET